MDTIEAILSRRTVRAYDPNPMPQVCSAETLGILWEA